MSKERLDYDIVIIGGGLIGLTVACNLIDKGLRLAIADKNNFEQDLNFDKASMLRMSAITLGSQFIFERCQVWQALDKSSLSPFRGMEVWEPALTSPLFFDAAEIGQPHLGTIVKNSDLQTALMQKTQSVSGLDRFSCQLLKSVKQITPTIRLLEFTSGLSITTQLVIGADGAQSSVRYLSGIQHQIKDYHQEAMVATVQTELAHNQIARQIFLPTGPVAFLPLADPHYCSIVWSTTPEEAVRLQTLSDKLFCKELTKVFEQRLGRIESTSSRLIFPLKAQRCKRYINSGIALVGDAANTIHPLAGQGANLGIADAACLARVILEARQKKRALGMLHTLRRYERDRHFHHRLMGGGVDFIKHIFEVKTPFFVNARHFGLEFIEKAPWLKSYFMQYAMGDLKY